MWIYCCNINRLSYTTITLRYVWYKTLDRLTDWRSAASEDRSCLSRSSLGRVHVAQTLTNRVWCHSPQTNCCVWFILFVHHKTLKMEDQPIIIAYKPQILILPRRFYCVLDSAAEVTPVHEREYMLQCSRWSLVWLACHTVDLGNAPHLPLPASNRHLRNRSATTTNDVMLVN